ncbi:MAG TPA: DPP IV N-terminal domain-containing protein [Bryobacteraceae bacterium]|nr:DPP IV N-terminal domain-containing protein [Bryobacteraceae bacterium]
MSRLSRYYLRISTISILSTAAAAGAYAQGTLADYERAQSLRSKTQGGVINEPRTPTWIGETDHFWYARIVKGGTEFVLVDAATGAKKPAFDQEKLAAGINAAAGGHYTALALPFATPAGGRGGAGGRGAPTAGGLTFVDNDQAVEFGVNGFLYKCSLSDYSCSKGASIPAAVPGRRGGAPEADDEQPAPWVSENDGGDPTDGLEYQPFPQAGGGGRAFNGQSGCAPAPAAENAQGGGRAGRGGRGGRGAAAPAAGAAAENGCRSFDGKWIAIVENYNIFLRPTTSNEPATALSFDGSEGNYYTMRSVAWSPDSKHLVAYHTRPGYDRQVHYIQSSPTDQVQPKHFTTNTLPNAAISGMYRKPGDAVDIAYPSLFDVSSHKEVEVDNALFPNPYDITAPVWWKDSRGFTFEYNQRGHQVYRVIEVDAQTGKARPLIDEQSKTFIYYNQLGAGLSAGRRYRRDINDGKEIIWASERDGWEHLYLYDGAAGHVKNQITKGDWLVRNVDYIDEAKRQIYFEAGGLIAGQDPYFTQYCRINFDGTGLTKLTDADGTHTVTFSPDRKYYVDLWQRVDLPPQAQLRRTEDQKVVADLDKGDASALLALGIKFPEVFVAKGRDNKTDIWGVIIKPTNFDPSKKYPVIENIYAGPQGSFVPKTFSALSGDQAMAELGFIVVHIDGMGTSNRSKAFHDVAWKNLGDAGFPDRILWHKAAAAKYPWYDITRVGIFGTSAGGQNSLGGVLFHPEFYKVVVTNSGCHDNRMDKMWWNEQWMGWPLGPQYPASSNVDNAYRLQGKALIIVGEMDTNVDPASSLQVVNALVKAHKHFDMLYIPGQDHGVGILGSEHYRDDYFVHHLLGVEPPDWNKVSLPAEPAPTGGN